MIWVTLSAMEEARVCRGGEEFEKEDGSERSFLFSLRDTEL